MDKQDELARLIFRASYLHPGEDEATFAEKWEDWRQERSQAHRVAAAVRSFMGSDEVVERVKAAMIERIGPVFGSPEYLADPVKLARATKRRDDAAENYARAALSAAIGEDGGGRG